MIIERVLLQVRVKENNVCLFYMIFFQTIKFDLQVDHPYTSLIKYAKCLKDKGDEAKLNKMVQGPYL